MKHYASLADSKYLPQLLVLYESLKKHSSEEFDLQVLAMDQECFSILSDLYVPNLLVTPLRAFTIPNSMTLFGNMSNRTWQEYCWTCASQFTDWCLLGEAIDSMTNLDADLMFFSDPKVIFDEIGDRSIAVIPHRLAENKDNARLSQNGKFNVSWVTFRNNIVGRECLSTWAAQCRKRCSAEIGCGDQGYLDEWPAKYAEELCVIQNIGAGLAPWNVSSYEVTDAISALTEYCACGTIEPHTHGPYVDDEPIVFYHYHEFKDYQRLTNYKLRPTDVRIIYVPYIDAVNAANKRIQEIRVSA